MSQAAEQIVREVRECRRLSGSDIGVNYQLQVNNLNTGTPVSGTGSAISFGNQGVTGTYTALATNASTGCSDYMSGDAIVNVTLPGNNTGGNKSLCSGSSVTLGATATVGHTYSWSPATALSSTNISDPIANPTVTTSYTLTEIITATGCTSTNSITVTVNSLPVVTISTYYCGGSGNVELSSNAFSSYLWSTGANTQTINVQLAGNYKLTVTNAAGCTGVDSTQVSIEYISNGSFTFGNTGFTSAYTYHPGFYSGTDTSGLYPEGLYAVGSNAHNYHPNFYGTDHTNPGTGLFMIINGNTTPEPIPVWSEQVNVNANTTYYFSAWGMSLNNAGNYAQLWFAINGEQVGSTVTLPAGVESTSGPFVWTSFYGTWYSGTATSATLEIEDLQLAKDGNDFGLDDISCSTFSFLALTVAPTAPAVCAGGTINLSANLTGGNGPYIYSWEGPNSFTSSLQNPTISNATEANAGVYSLTVTDAHDCTASGTATVTVNVLPAIFNVTGGGTYCSGGSGVAVGLSGSASGVNYQLLLNGGNSGSAIAGTGSAISFGNQTAAGTYTAEATNAITLCTNMMNGSAVVNSNTPSTAPTGISGTTAICHGGSTTLTATGGTARDRERISVGYRFSCWIRHNSRSDTCFNNSDADIYHNVLGKKNRPGAMFNNNRRSNTNNNSQSKTCFSIERKYRHMQRVFGKSVSNPNRY